MTYCKYSIIIPHHNTPVLLQRLISSIPLRDDTEIIVVDDNSDDSIVDFDNFPGMNRQDVTIIFDKSGKYGGHARNIGLSHAKGDWIIFADSDDYFNYCLNDILTDYLDDESDIIFFKANSVDCVYYTNSNRSSLVNSYIDLFSKNKVKAELNLRYKFGEPWCKIIKRDIITDNKIFFEERSIHNDTAFSYKVGFYAKKISVDKRAIYCVTTRENSVSKVISEQKKIERIECFATADKFYKEHHIPVKILTHYNQLSKCFLTNKRTYRQGFVMMHNMGFNPSVIRLYVLFFMFYNVFARIIKK